MTLAPILRQIFITRRQNSRIESPCDHRFLSYRRSEEIPNKIKNPELRLLPQFGILVSFIFLENSSYCNNASVSCRRGKLNTCLWCTCMNNGISSDVNRHMSAVTYDISWLHSIRAHTISNTCQCTGRMWKAYTKCCIYTHNKSRTICSVCQACTTPNIWITNKLTCIICNCLSIATTWRSIASARV